jgi:hypothetical protein
MRSARAWGIASRCAVRDHQPAHREKLRDSLRPNMKLLLPKDSPLRNPPALESPQKAAVDALRFALDMTHISYLRLIEGLHRIGEMHRAGVERTDEPTTALVDAWAVIDNLWRLRCVLRSFPRLKRTPDLEADLRALETVEPLRNGIQHLAGEFRNSDRTPLLGSLNWFWSPDDPNAGGYSICFAAGALRDGVIPIANPAGKSYHRPVGLVTLSAFGAEIELSALVVRVVQMAMRLDKGFRTATAGTVPAGADPLFVLTMEFRRDDPGVVPPIGDIT